MSKEDNIVDNVEKPDVKVEEGQAQQAETAKEKSPEEVIAELKEALLRTRADFENFRQRSQRDSIDARAYGKISAIEEIIPVLDTFKMAMQATTMTNADLQTLVAGMNMIQNQFNNSLNNLGVVELNAVGEKFNPHLHEAVSEQPSSEVAAGMVIRQNRCGYKLGDKLIRAVSVVVSSGPEVVAEAKKDEGAE